MKKPQLQHLPLDDLLPYARNAKQHPPEQIAQIAASIKEFGFNAPVLVDGDKGIIAGHGRVLAARKLGLATVPCVVLDHLTDAQKRAYIIADNRLGDTDLAPWDWEMLQAEIDALKETNYDYTVTGFTDESLADNVESMISDLQYQSSKHDNKHDDSEYMPEQAGYELKDKNLPGRALLCAKNIGFDLVVRLKDNLPMDEISFWGKQLAKLIPDVMNIDLITSAPSSGKRPQDQHLAMLLAKQVADHLGKPFALTIVNNNQRKRRGNYVTKLQELTDNNHQFKYQGQQGKSIVIVDDVIYTRSTMTRCFMAVREANCNPFAVVLYRA